MQSLNTLKSKSQEAFDNLVDQGKRPSTKVNTWGVTAVAGAAGALAVTAAAKGVLAIVATLAYPPVAVTLGALGGGALGWSYMQKKIEATDTGNETTMDSELSQDGIEQDEDVVSVPEDAAAE